MPAMCSARAKCQPKVFASGWKEMRGLRAGVAVKLAFRALISRVQRGGREEVFSGVVLVVVMVGEELGGTGMLRWSEECGCHPSFL